MKSEIIVLFSLLTLALFTSLVAADVIETGLPITISIGNPTSTTTTTTAPQNITVDNPANVNFQIVARDENGQSKQLNITLYDNVGHDFLNSSNFIGLGYLFSPTSLADFEFDFDNKNLDVVVTGLNLTNMDGTSSQITIQNTNPQITSFTVYKAYKVELPASFSYSNIVLKISLADLSDVNYNNITIYRCGNYNSVTNICSDNWVIPSQTLSVDSTNKIVSLTIDHFSVYAVGSGSGSSSSSTTTTTSQTQTTTYTTTTTYSAPPANNPPAQNSVGNPGGGGGGAYNPPITTTTTQTPTTTTTVLIIKRNDTSSSSSTSQTSETVPITGFLGLSNQIAPLLIAGVVVVASIAAISWMKNKYTLPRLDFWKKSYKTFPNYNKTKKSKGKKSNTELRLSL
jgi:hypothetical protein